MEEVKDPFNGKRGRQKGQTKDIVIIKDPLLDPYEIHLDSSCYNLVEPGYNDSMVTVGYFNSLSALLGKLARYKLVEKKGEYTLREYINEHKQVIENLTKVIKYD
jgi:hypothetical protein